MACLCMPQSMSDNLKNQNLKKRLKNFFQNLKVAFFRYMICERLLQDNSGHFLCSINARPVQLLEL